MSMGNCGCRCGCNLAALIVSGILGVLAAFFQITGAITVVPAFLWVALGIAVAYLGILLGVGLLSGRQPRCVCGCASLNAVLSGILGAILFSAILLIFGVVATSIFSAILVGLMVFSLVLIVTGSACLVRCVADCGNE